MDVASRQQDSQTFTQPLSFTLDRVLQGIPRSLDVWLFSTSRTPLAVTRNRHLRSPRKIQKTRRLTPPSARLGTGLRSAPSRCTNAQ
jgi:hypothetical protein